jgi:glycerol-1-phosphatase
LSTDSDTPNASKNALSDDQASIIYKYYRDQIQYSYGEATPREANFSVLAKHYDCFLFDGFGTLYVDDYIYEDSIEALEWLRSKGKQVRLVSNTASRDVKTLHEDLWAKGLFFHPSEIITSGSLIPLLSQKLNITEALLLGKDSSASLLVQAGIQRTDSPRQNVVVLTSPVPLDSPEAIQARSILRHPNSLFLVCNPDEYAPSHTGSPYPVASACAWDFMEKTKCHPRTLFIGKPFPLIFMRARHTLFPSTGSVIMVGDTLGTDITGANHQEIDSVLVKRGNALFPDLDPLSQQNVQPVFTVADLRI